MSTQGIILDFRRDRRLLGSLPHHRDPATQSAWDACLAAVYGLPLTPEHLELFQRYTGRRAPRPGGYPEAVVITGRQSGKTQTAADIVTFEAVTAPQSADGTYALLTAQDQRGALRTVFRYVANAFDRSAMLKRSVANRTADQILLSNGVTTAAYPCRPAAVRGLRARVAVLDELAFFRTSENIPTDREMLRAIRPTLATTGGKLIVLSSPYGQSGALWDLHRQHYAREDSPTLIWVAPAPAMNPTLPANYLQRMEQDDPEAYRAEVLGEFRTGVATFFDVDALQACIADRRELLSAPGIKYVGACDPASGGGQDRYTVAIGVAGFHLVAFISRTATGPPATLRGKCTASRASTRRGGSGRNPRGRRRTIFAS